jgi:hypothetical protein
MFILTLSHTLGSLSWPALLQTLALVVSPRLGLRQAECFPTISKVYPSFFIIFSFDLNEFSMKICSTFNNFSIANQNIMQLNAPFITHEGLPNDIKGD